MAPPVLTIIEVREIESRQVKGEIVWGFWKDQVAQVN